MDRESTETWREPWIWRPSDWPGEKLELNIVENENPGPIVGFGNQSAVLFSYNGATPGPTIRMRGDETLSLRLRNMLGRNFGKTFVGPFPDPVALPLPKQGEPPIAMVTKADSERKSRGLGNERSDFCLGEHTNGVHSARTTNLHTHGLHVRPGRNPDGTHSDNVILRLINQDDFRQRQLQNDSPECEWLRSPDQTTYLRDDEQAGGADYEFRLGGVQGAMRAAAAKLRRQGPPPPQPHPPGTHWYHPHSHGATHNQVASGMAGFLIVEGDVDEAINFELTEDPRPDPQRKTGQFDYIERLMFIQRVFALSNAVDPDAPTQTQTLKAGQAAKPAVNGDQTPMIINMRPGAIERWRVLNGSVDGRGFKRFMVVKGQYAVEQKQGPAGIVSTLVKLRDDDTAEFTPATRAEVDEDKQQLHQLAFDGVTLVEGSGEDARYFLKDLSTVETTGPNPLDGPTAGDRPNAEMLANFERCYTDEDAVKNCYVRPNEVYLGPANRTDIMFQAPPEPGRYTVLARAVVVHADNYQNRLQTHYDEAEFQRGPQDIVVAYLLVEGVPAKTKEGIDYELSRLNDVLPEVPPYLRPIEDDEIQVRDGTPDRPADPDADPGITPSRVGRYRTRTITYSGWGAADFPLITTFGEGETATNFRAFVEADQRRGVDGQGPLDQLRYAKLIPSGDTGGSARDEYILLAPNLRTMAISGSTSDALVEAESEPEFPVPKSMGRKFSPDDPQRPIMVESTAESGRSTTTRSASGPTPPRLRPDSWAATMRANRCYGPTGSRGLPSSPRAARPGGWLRSRSTIRSTSTKTRVG